MEIGGRESSNTNTNNNINGSSNSSSTIYVGCRFINNNNNNNGSNTTSTNINIIGQSSQRSELQNPYEDAASLLQKLKSDYKVSKALEYFKTADDQKKQQKSESINTELTTESSRVATESSGSVSKQPVKGNFFKEGGEEVTKRDPLSEYPEKCPPSGADSVVVYTTTTSLQGVRRTSKDHCKSVKSILEGYRVVFDERNVSLSKELLNELTDLVCHESGERDLDLPKVFVKGRYIGGIEEVSKLHESGRLGKILSLARAQNVVRRRQACQECSGTRLVACLDCGGCKVLLDGIEQDYCCKCSLDGLIPCPTCCSGSVSKGPVKSNFVKKGGEEVIERDPLSEYPEKCPPSGADSVVVYTTTTSLQGLRSTCKDHCKRVRSILEGHRVVFDERDVSLSKEFLNELSNLVGDESGMRDLDLPKVFVKGRYVGGLEEVSELHKSGGLRKILSFARAQKVGRRRQACQKCRGTRFVACLDCGGCKVLGDGFEQEFCSKCSLDGSIPCPSCG